MADLIEKLRRWPTPLHLEAAAALEAAREDAWRALVVPGLRVYKGDHVVQVDAGKRGLFTERYADESDLPRALRAVQDVAIDQARGKGGGE